MTKRTPAPRPTYRDEDELSVLQLAKYFGIGRRSASGLVERGRFPNARRLNPDAQRSAVLIPFRDIRAYESTKKRRARALEA
jgi:hypothetical protein